MEAKEFQTTSVSPLLGPYFCTDWSKDDRISVITEKGLHVMELIPSPTSTTPRLKFKRTWLRPSPTLATDNTGVDYDSLVLELDKSKVYNLILDANLTPCLGYANPTVPRHLKAIWSPPGLLYYGRCVLATLTNMGAVKIEFMYNDKWREVCDISACWLDRCRATWDPFEEMTPEKQYDLLVERAAQLRTVSISWSGFVGTLTDGYSLLAMAQRNNIIVIWKISLVYVVPGRPSTAAQRDPQIMATFSSQLDFASTLRWIDSDRENFNSAFLVAGDKAGVVKMWKIREEKVEESEQTIRLLHHQIDLYNVPDRIQISMIDYYDFEGNSDHKVLLVAKENVLVALLINSEGEKIQMSAECFRDVAITGLVVMERGVIVLSTRNGHLYSLEIKIGENESSLKITYAVIPTSINFTHNACYGIAASEHRMFWICAATVSQSYDHLVLRQPTIISFFTLTNFSDPLATLVENKSNRLTRFWDCLEAVRINFQKENLRPPVNIIVEQLDSITSYQLRLFLWLSAISLTINGDPEPLSKTHKLIEKLLFAQHACNLVERMLSSIESEGSTLSGMEINCLGALRMWLLSFLPTASKNWTRISERIGKILTGSQGMEELIEEQCTICDSEIKKESLQENGWRFATCIKGHSLPRCSVSLLPCTALPHFICHICGILTLEEFVTPTDNSCLYCESILRPQEILSLEEMPCSSGCNETGQDE